MGGINTMYLCIKCVEMFDDLVVDSFTALGGPYRITGAATYGAQQQRDIGTVQPLGSKHVAGNFNSPLVNTDLWRSYVILDI